MAQAAQAEFGGRAGNYQILGEAGSGGMGKVYKAFDVTLRRTVALKFLFPEQSTGDRERVLREARAASTLDHKNVGTIYAVEEAGDGRLFIVMPYYEGESLASRMHRSEVSAEDAIHIVEEIGQGLAYAHAHQIVHRDIKPSNVIITVDGVVKIVDFGLARSAGPDESTQTMNIGGTLPYMSPEQVSGKPVDARTDIWSLGVLLYQLLTGQVPFQGDSAAAVINGILHLPPPKMANAPFVLQAIVYKALAKKPECRYQSCGEMLSDLQAAKTSEPSTASSWTTRRMVNRRRNLASASYGVVLRRPWRVLAWTALAVALMVTGSLIVRQTLSPQHDAPENVQNQTYNTNPAAYQSYLKGLDYLQHYYQPVNIDKAIQLLEETVRTDPRFALAYVALGEAYWDKYRLDQDARWFEKASSYCEKAADLNSNLPAVYVMLSRIHSGSGKYDLALQEAQRALQLDRRNADATLALADVYGSTGRTDEAEETYKRAAASRPDSWDGHYRLAVFYYRQQRYADAAQQFRRVVEMAPDHGPAFTNLGVMLRHLGREKEAEDSFKKSIALNPSYSALANLGDLYYRQGRYAESAEMSTKALELNQEDYRVWTNLAIAYEQMGRASKAAQAYDKALAKLKTIEPLRAEDPAIQASMGLIYAKKHMRHEALAALEAASALSAEDGAVWGEIAEGYEYLGERAQAIHCIRQALARGWTLQDANLIPGLRPLLADTAARRQIQSAKNSQTDPKSLR